MTRQTHSLDSFQIAIAFVALEEFLASFVLENQSLISMQLLCPQLEVEISLLLVDLLVDYSVFEKWRD